MLFFKKKNKELIYLNITTIKLILDTYNKIDLITIKGLIKYDYRIIYTYILYIMYSEHLSVNEALNATKLDNDYKFIRINKKGDKRDHQCSTVTSNLLKELNKHTKAYYYPSHSKIFITNNYDQNYHEKMMRKYLEATLKKLKIKGNVPFDSFTLSFNNHLEINERSVAFYLNSDPYILLKVDEHLDLFKKGWINSSM